MNRKSNWKPEFPETNDRKVSMSRDEVQTFTVSREVGLIISENIEKRSPACFWIDEQKAYLRMNWGSWYKVSNDSPETVSAICRRHTAKLIQAIGNRSVDCFIPVYHIDRLPAELFGGLSGADAGDETSAKKERPSSAQLLREAGMIERMGEVVCEYRKGDDEFVLLRGERRLLLVSFFTHRDTEWLADEVPFTDEPPMWFSVTTHLQSPLYAVGLAARYLMTECNIDAAPVVILDDEIDILNLREVLDVWRKTGVLVCYCRREEARIPAFDPNLCAEPGEIPDKRTVAAARKALEAYVPLQPKDWEELLHENGDDDDDDDDDDEPSPEVEARRRYCLGRYHSDDPCCDFRLVYDFHQLRLLPDEASENPPGKDVLAEIGKKIAKIGVYSGFGIENLDMPDDPDEARANAAVADQLFAWQGDRWDSRHDPSENDEQLKDWLVQIERFWRRGNPIALRTVDLTGDPIWSLVFETEPVALFFQYPEEEKWKEHSKGLFKEYVEEYLSASRAHPELTIFCVVILESTLPEILDQLNASSPEGMFFVSPGTLNETVMRIFMEKVFGGADNADDPENR